MSVTRTKTREQCMAEAMLLGSKWSYHAHTHTYVEAMDEWWKYVVDSNRAICAETLEPLDNREIEYRVVNGVKPHDHEVEAIRREADKKHRAMHG